MKIAVAGTGYVGLSIATLLAQHNEVVAVDVIPEKVAAINARKSPIRDEYIERFFAEKSLKLKATLDATEAYSDATYVVVATPTNYDPHKNFFDTSAVESVVGEVLKINSNAKIVIKSTVPVGFTKNISEKYSTEKILFSPEFLREIISIMIIAIMTEMELPKFHSPTVINWFSIRLPTKKYCPPPKSLGMKNELTAGKNTNVIPLITPGRESGSVTRLNVCAGLAPKSALASNKE